MKEVLKEKRKTSIAQLKSHAEETRDVEQEIFVASRKLKTVQDENLKFEQVCFLKCPAALLVFDVLAGKIAFNKIWIFHFCNFIIFLYQISCRWQDFIS